MPDHVAHPGHDPDFGVLVDVGALAADDAEVAPGMWAIEDVVRIDEIHRIRRDLSVLSTVQNHIDLLAGPIVFQAGKARAGLCIAARAVNTLDSLEGRQIVDVEVIIRDNHVDTVRITLQGDGGRVHVAFDIRRGDNAATVCIGVNTKILPPRLGRAIDATDEARCRRLADQGRKAVDLLAAERGAIRINTRGHLIPESILGGFGPFFDEVEHRFIATIHEFFEPADRDGDRRLLPRISSCGHRVIERDIDRLIAAVPHKRLVHGIAEFLHDFSAAVCRFLFPLLAKERQEGVIVADIVREGLGAVFERRGDDITPVNCGNERGSHRSDLSRGRVRSVDRAPADRLGARRT